MKRLVAVDRLFMNEKIFTAKRYYDHQNDPQLCGRARPPHQKQQPSVEAISQRR